MKVHASAGKHGVADEDIQVSLHLRTPTRAGFPVRQGWLRDPEMMSYNAGWQLTHPGYDNDTGCIAWPETEWDAFEARIGSPAEQQGYFFVEHADGTPLGHAHYWVDNNIAEIGFNIVPNHRGHGLGSATLQILLDHIWANTAVDAVTNEFEESRVAAAATHLRAGFTRAGTGGTQAKPTTLWRLDRVAAHEVVDSVGVTLGAGPRQDGELRNKPSDQGASPCPQTLMHT